MTRRSNPAAHYFTAEKRDQLVADTLKGRPDLGGEARRTIDAMSRMFAKSAPRDPLEARPEDQRAALDAATWFTNPGPLPPVEAAGNRCEPAASSFRRVA